MAAIVDWLIKPGAQGPVLSTYSSAIASLRLQIQALEARNNALSEDLENLRWQIELRGMLEAAALDGVRRAVAPADRDALQRSHTSGAMS